MLKPVLLLLLLMSAAVSAADKAAPSILILGDSLSAGYGMSLEQSWVALLEQRLARYTEEAGYRYEVVNASVSGDTTRGALERLDDILERQQPVVAIIELGANDGLRGIPAAEMQRNLAAIIEKLQHVGSRVVLVPMKMPPNYGSSFTSKFEAVYDTLANKYDLVLSQFILHDVAEHPDLMQDDGIHPTAAAQQKMLDNIWPVLEPILPSQNHTDEEQSQSL